MYIRFRRVKVMVKICGPYLYSFHFSDVFLYAYKHVQFSMSLTICVYICLHQVCNNGTLNTMLLCISIHIYRHSRGWLCCGDRWGERAHEFVGHLLLRQHILRRDARLAAVQHAPTQNAQRSHLAPQNKSKVKCVKYPSV